MMRTAIRLAVLVVTLVVIAWVLRNGNDAEAEVVGGDDSPATAAATADPQESLPPSGDEAAARLAESPRHGEWVMVRAGSDSIRSWVVYPERADAAPVVVVIHEIFGMSPWIRAVADQLAAEGFIAIAPDLLTMMDVPTDEAGDADPDAARTAIRSLDREVASGYLSAVAEWGMNLPAARPAYGVVGFCWGGTTSFVHAVNAPELGAAVVYYGSSPEGEQQYASIQAPVLGLYGGDDARVNATIPAAEEAMQALGKSYEPHTFDGAGHGFLRGQDGQDGANMAATEQAWPLTVAFFRQHLSE